LAEHGILGLPHAEEARGGAAIERAQTGVTAFVGRTVKGPLNRPVRVGSFAEFRRTFGGLWHPSTLSYAIEQYFENGGRHAIVVRIANGSRPPTLALPAGRSELTLAGVDPGSREYLRAAVDYDGIGTGESDRFNLVVQRVRMPGTEQIEDQETFRRISIEPESARYVGDMLLESRLVRLQGAAPLARPEPTTGGPAGHPVRYVASRSGDDGAPLTDYDVIGSAVSGTGLFALQAEEGFDLLCIPPLARERDVGLATLLVAGRLCRERHAMLIVDPPMDWTTPQAALAALRTWPFRSGNAAMFFPRVIAPDRLRSRTDAFGSAAAAAGMLARGDEALPVWAPVQGEEPLLRPAFRMAVEATESERARLAQAGINTLHAVRPSGSSRRSPCTLAGDGSGAADLRPLAARRLALFVVRSIARGARWLLTAPNTPASWRRAQAQVEEFLDELDREGAFAGGEPQDSYFAICDERVNRRETVAEGKVNLLFGIAAEKPAQFHAWLVTYQPGAPRASDACRVRSVAVNRLATSPQRVDWEIETSILRG
jgi:phage tail sheath protein FI